MLIYGVVDIRQYPWVTVLALLCSIGLILGVMLLKRLKTGTWIYRINTALYVCLILYMVLIGGEAGSKVLWIYTVPLITAFVLGAREGAIWSIAMLILMTAIFKYPFSDESVAHQYPISMQIRLTVTFFICSVVTIWLEYSRSFYLRDSINKTTRLEAKHNELVFEMKSRLKLEKQLIDQANNDSLSGLLNRGAFFELAERELRRHLRNSNPLSFIIFDIDYFKQVNDQYGHPVGDLLIQAIAQASRDCIRDIDLIGRVGGEEFAIVLVKTNEDAALIVAERIRQQVENMTLESTKGPVKCTISAGVYTAKIGDSIDTIYRESDIALYKAKTSGRNRIMSYSEI